MTRIPQSGGKQDRRRLITIAKIAIGDIGSMNMAKITGWPRKDASPRVASGSMSKARRRSEGSRSGIEGWMFRKVVKYYKPLMIAECFICRV